MSTSSTTPITLRGMTWDHPRGYDCLHAADATRGGDSAVRVAWDKRSLKDFGDAPLSQLARTYDLLVIDHPHAGQAAASGALLPLDRLLAAEALDALDDGQSGPSFTSYHYAGHLWALAIDAACQVASYRPDRIDPSELPRDWDGFFEFAKAQRRKGCFCGMALCPTDALCSFLTLSAQFGDAPDETGKWVSESTFLDVVDMLRRIADVCVPESLNWNPIRLYEAMATDTSGTLVYAPLAFGYTNYARNSYRPQRLAYSGIPGRTHALLGGAGIAVSAHSAHPEQAAAYGLWLCQAERQCGVYLEHGGQPAHPAVWRDAAADALCGGFFSGTRDTLRHAYQRPRFPGWPHFQETLGDTVLACLRSELDARVAWSQLNGMLDKVVGSV